MDTKDKKFNVDKNVLRILLAMVSRADDFLSFNRLNPSKFILLFLLNFYVYFVVVCPYEGNKIEYTPHQESPSTPKYPIQQNFVEYCDLNNNKTGN